LTLEEDAGHRVGEDVPGGEVLYLVHEAGYTVEHMFVLGIDPGLTRTGYGIIESKGGRERAVAAGVLRTDPNLSTADRLVELRVDIESIVDEYDIDAAAIEQVFVNRNRNTAMAVARASGVIMEAIARKGIPVSEYTPSQMKMAVTGSGSADKQQVSAVVSMRLGLQGVDGPADVADALGIAMCHAQHSALQTSGANS
jgi:crossover junction endodeoxyribonuclease RuvC